MEVQMNKNTEKTAQKNTQERESESKIRYPFVYSKNGEIYYSNSESGHEYPVANDITLESVKDNIDTKEIQLELSTLYKGERKTVTIDRSDLRKKEILNIQKYGFDILENNAKLVIWHIDNQERLCDKRLIHSYVGFDNYGGNSIFKHYKAVGIDSTYNGSLEIKPKGSLSKWLEMVRSNVLPHIPLQLALCIGFSAAVVGFIGRDVSLDTILAHIYNDSTKGKTTALMLALSTFGCPDAKKKFSLANTWLATENYLVSMLNGNFGLPFGLDEASMFGNNSNFTSIVYRLASNKDKGRLNKDTSLKQTGSWNTVIISTGEFSLLSKCFKNKGLNMRVLELGNITWTANAKSAEAIKETVLNNYGHAGIRFAKELLRIGKDKVIFLWERWRADIKAVMHNAEQNSFADRSTAKLAPIMVAAEIASELFQLDLDFDGILEILLDSEQEVEESRDIGTDAYEYFIEQFNKYRRHFGIPEVVITSHSIMSDQNGKRSFFFDLWGATHTDRTTNETEIYILTGEFDRILKEGGFQDSKIVLKLWKERNILNCEKDRYTRKRIIGEHGVPSKVYCIKAPKLETEDNVIKKELNGFKKHRTNK